MPGAWRVYPLLALAAAVLVPALTSAQNLRVQQDVVVGGALDVGNVTTTGAGNAAIQNNLSVGGTLAVQQKRVDPFAQVPTGTVLAFAGATLPPGFLFCDGTIKKRADYPSLAVAMGATYGGDGVTTFGVPDLRGMFIRGLSNMSSPIDPTLASTVDAGRALGTRQEDRFQGHWHVTGTHSGSDNDFTGWTTGGAGRGWGAGYGGTFLRARTPMADNAGNGAPRFGPETRPVNVALKYIIKT